MKPVRKIPLKHQSVRGFYTSVRWGRQVAFESTLERDFLILTDFDPSVVSVTEQPCRIRFSDSDGKNHRYTPDFYVERVAGRHSDKLIEIKYNANLLEDGAKLKPAFEAAETFANENDWSFEVLTEDNIRCTRLENAKFLLPYRRHLTDHGYCARWIKGIEIDGPCVATDLASALWPN